MILNMSLIISIIVLVAVNDASACIFIHRCKANVYNTTIHIADIVAFIKASPCRHYLYPKTPVNADGPFLVVQVTGVQVTGIIAHCFPI